MEVYIAEKAGSAPVAVGRTYDFVLWLLPKVEKFPRSFRFTVGDRLVLTGLDLLMLLVDAAYSANKEHLLDEANRKINGVRYLLRLSKDLHLVPVDSYAFAAEQIEEIGRMVGGWRRAAGRRG